MIKDRSSSAPVNDVASSAGKSNVITLDILCAKRSVSVMQKTLVMGIVEFGILVERAQQMSPYTLRVTLILEEGMLSDNAMR